MMFNSSPTYPASVSVVASAMVNGTFNIFAMVLAKRVFPGTGGTDEQDVALLDIDPSHVGMGKQSSVVIINGDGQDFLGPFLPMTYLI